MSLQDTFFPEFVQRARPLRSALDVSFWIPEVPVEGSTDDVVLSVAKRFLNLC